MKTGVATALAPAVSEETTASLENFDLLVDVYRPKIFRFLIALLRDRDSAETLTQECFVKAFRARERFRGDSSLGTWLMQIAVNLARDHTTNSRLKFWRRAQRSGVDLNAVREFLADGQSSPETLASAKQQVEAVWGATLNLPEKQRTVFLLRFLEDMDLLEIATATGMKEGTVKTHLFRAIQAVRSRLEGRK